MAVLDVLHLVILSPLLGSPEDREVAKDRSPVPLPRDRSHGSAVLHSSTDGGGIVTALRFFFMCTSVPTAWETCSTGTECVRSKFGDFRRLLGRVQELEAPPELFVCGLDPLFEIVAEIGDEWLRSL